jgi:tetratricopeptide (TPR) repeat protein
MPLPALTPQDAILEERLPALSTGSETPVDRATFFIDCAGCGFSGSDGAFAAYPTQAHRLTQSLLEFVEQETAAGLGRKCPECHKETTAIGARWHVGCPSAASDIVIEKASGATTLSVVDARGRIRSLAADSPLLLEACLDSQERVARLLAEIDASKRDEARSLFSAVIAARPKSPLPKLGLARLLLLEDQEEAALSVLEEAAASADSVPTAAAELANLLAEIALSRKDQELAEMAIGWLQVALRHFKSHPLLRLQLGRMHLFIGQDEAARHSLELALQHESTSFDAARDLTRLAIREGRGAEAHHLSSQLREIDPDDPEISRLAAWSAHLCGKNDEALVLLQELQRREPDHVETIELARRLSGSGH